MTRVDSNRSDTDAPSTGTSHTGTEAPPASTDTSHAGTGPPRTDTDPPTAPELPTLDPGLTLLNASAPSALYSLVVDHVLCSGGSARWVDARNRAVTGNVAALAPDDRVLERIQVARAFTAHQHSGLVASLESVVDSDVALIVAPCIEWFYADSDRSGSEAAWLLEDALERLRAISTAQDLPVVMTRHTSTGLGSLIEEHADATLACTSTPFGPRFSGPDFETLVYPEHGGVQTTLAFWRRVLAARHAAPGESAAVPDDATTAPNDAPGVAGPRPGEHGNCTGGHCPSLAVPPSEADTGW